MLKVTTALRKIVGTVAKIVGVQGGQGAAKTFSIIMVLVDYALTNSDVRVVVTSEELSKMKKTVIRDFKKIMKLSGKWNEDRFTSGAEYSFANGSSFEFIGLDKADIGKGFRGDVLYCNEGNKVGFEFFRQIATRFKRIYIDFNPDEIFWFHEHYAPRPDCKTLILTFKDNEEISESEREEILLYRELGFNEDGSVKSEYWANKWRVYGEGLPGKLDGLVFSYKLIDSVPEDAEFVAKGLDFGYSVDPSAMAGVYRWGANGLIIDEEIYKRRLTNPDLAKLISERPGFRDWDDIVADSAEPKSIAELQELGLNVFPATKGRDSIKNGIDILQRFDIYLTKNSKNYISEFNSYRWATVKATGEKTGKPIDANNHGIDGVRYVGLMFLAEGKGMLE